MKDWPGFRRYSLLSIDLQLGSLHPRQDKVQDLAYCREEATMKITCGAMREKEGPRQSAPLRPLPRTCTEQVLHP